MDDNGRYYLHDIDPVRISCVIPAEAGIQDRSDIVNEIYPVSIETDKPYQSLYFKTIKEYGFPPEFILMKVRAGMAKKWRE